MIVGMSAHGTKRTSPSALHMSWLMPDPFLSTGTPWYDALS